MARQDNFFITSLSDRTFGRSVTIVELYELVHSGGSNNNIYNFDGSFKAGGVTATIPSASSLTFVDDRTEKEGIIYGDDYSSSFTSNSLISKTYADSFLGGNALDGSITTPVNNGYVVAWNDSGYYELVEQSGGGAGTVTSVGGGTNITVDSADPANPVVNLDDEISVTTINGITLKTNGTGNTFLNDEGAYTAASGTTSNTIYTASDTMTLTDESGPREVIIHDIESSYHGLTFLSHNSPDSDPSNASRISTFSISPDYTSSAAFYNGGIEIGALDNTNADWTASSGLIAESAKITIGTAVGNGSGGTERVSATNITFYDNSEDDFGIIVEDSTSSVGMAYLEVNPTDPEEDWYNDYYIKGISEFGDRWIPNTGYVKKLDASEQKTGLLSGGTLSQADAQTVRLSAGSGRVIDTEFPTDIKYYDVTWQIDNDIDVSGLATGTYYPTIDKDANFAFLNVKDATEDDFRDYIIPGTYTVVSGFVASLDNEPLNLSYNSQVLEDFLREIIGSAVISGMLCSSFAGDLSFSYDDGRLYRESSNFTNDAKSPNVLDVTGESITNFYKVYIDSNGDVVSNDNALVTQIDPTQYNTGGGLSSVPNGHYSIQRIYWTPNGVRVAYGQKTYPTEIDAIIGIGEDGDQVDEGILSQIWTIGYLIVDGNETSLANAAFRNPSKFTMGGNVYTSGYDPKNIYTSDSVIDGPRVVSLEGGDRLTFTGYDTTSSDYSKRGRIVVDETVSFLGVGDGSLENSIAVKSNVIVVTDEINTKGLVYDIDYSANFTDLSLVDKSYTDSTLGGKDTLGISTPTATENGYSVVWDNDLNHYKLDDITPGSSTNIYNTSSSITEDRVVSVEDAAGEGISLTFLAKNGSGEEHTEVSINSVDMSWEASDEWLSTGNSKRFRISGQRGTESQYRNDLDHTGIVYHSSVNVFSDDTLTTQGQSDSRNFYGGDFKFAGSRNAWLEDADDLAIVSYNSNSTDYLNSGSIRIFDGGATLDYSKRDGGGLLLGTNSLDVHEHNISASYTSEADDTATSNSYSSLLLDDGGFSATTYDPTGTITTRSEVSATTTSSVIQSYDTGTSQGTNFTATPTTATVGANLSGAIRVGTIDTLLEADWTKASGYELDTTSANFGITEANVTPGIISDAARLLFTNSKGITVEDTISNIGLKYQTNYQPDVVTNPYWLPYVEYTNSVLGGNALNTSVTTPTIDGGVVTWNTAGHYELTTPAVADSIYTTSSNITSNRIVDALAHSLTFQTSGNGVNSFLEIYQDSITAGFDISADALGIEYANENVVSGTFGDSFDDGSLIHRKYADARYLQLTNVDIDTGATIYSPTAEKTLTFSSTDFEFNSSTISLLPSSSSFSALNLKDLGESPISITSTNVFSGATNVGSLSVKPFGVSVACATDDGEYSQVQLGAINTLESETWTESAGVQIDRVSAHMGYAESTNGGTFDKRTSVLADKNNPIRIIDSLENVGLAYFSDYSVNGQSYGFDSSGDRWIPDLGFISGHFSRQVLAANGFGGTTSTWDSSGSAVIDVAATIIYEDSLYVTVSNASVVKILKAGRYKVHFQIETQSDLNGLSVSQIRVKSNGAVSNQNRVLVQNFSNVGNLAKTTGVGSKTVIITQAEIDADAGDNEIEINAARYAEESGTPTWSDNTGANAIEITFLGT